ncbi:MAG: TetR/AcrR family transcriptional regulator [Clostridia bacterium]|nr:TetR/AcrR family transcriptional regulator [Clostridia bacterium]MBR2413120.1 TetR/AcrR family transcriptional regulator [Clostridia bacterium]
MAEERKAEYKNAVRSRQLIKNAYVALLNEKDVNKITVTDIIGRAGISRGTFYAHYADVRDLYARLEQDAIRTILTVIEETGIFNFYENPLPTLESNLRILERNKEYYRLLLTSCVGCSFVQKLSDDFATRFVPLFMERFSNINAEVFRSYISFASSGVRGMIFRWLDGTLKLSAPQCAQLMADMLLGAKPSELKND